MQAKVKKIMAHIFEVPLEEITVDASPDSVEHWDSIRHMNLVLALEEEFDVEFTDEQIVTMLNFQLILLNLKEVLQY